MMRDTITGTKLQETYRGQQRKRDIKTAGEAYTTGALWMKRMEESALTPCRFIADE